MELKGTFERTAVMKLLGYAVENRQVIYIVKDEGFYLMNCNFNSREEKPQGNVVYANGCRPENGWIGGDDFGESYNPKPMLELLEKTPTSDLIVKITDTQIAVGIIGGGWSPK